MTERNGKHPYSWSVPDALVEMYGCLSFPHRILNERACGRLIAQEFRRPTPAGAHLQLSPSSQVGGRLSLFFQKGAGAWSLGRINIAKTLMFWSEGHYLSRIDIEPAVQGSLQCGARKPGRTAGSGNAPHAVLFTCVVMFCTPRSPHLPSSIQRHRMDHGLE